jgi:hypothetical protein
VLQPQERPSARSARPLRARHGRHDSLCVRCPNRPAARVTEDIAPFTERRKSRNGSRQELAGKKEVKKEGGVRLGGSAMSLHPRTRRSAVLAAPLGALLAIVLTATPASAHTVTSITADCEHVTVNVANFPDGTSLHTVITVQGHGTITSDNVVNAATSSFSVDISGATAGMFGATANVTVDVSWTHEGPQHFEETVSLTCGTATTTTAAATTTTVGTVTSSSVPESTTTVPAPTSTSTTVASGSTTTVAFAGSTTSPTTVVGPASSSAPTTLVLNATAARTTGSGTLPFTGSNNGPMTGLGVVLVLTGTAMAAVLARKSHSIAGD